jgi:hypothetical protein
MAAGHPVEVMIMFATPPAAGRLRRLARLLIGPNELRRPSDRFEGVVMAVLLAAFIAAVTMASLAGVRTYQSQRTADARLRSTVAVLTASGPIYMMNGLGEVQARWQAPGGRERSGMLTTQVAPDIWNASRGTRVRIWVTPTGEPTAPPPGEVAMLLSAAAIPLWATGGSAVFLLLCYGLCRLVLDRRRLARWESAWALVGPRWTTRR